MVRKDVLKRAAMGVTMAAVLGVPAASQAANTKMQLPEKSTVRTLPVSNPHRVVVYDPDFPHLNATSAWFIDGDSGKVKGMIGTGMQSNLVFSLDHKHFYVTDTFWSRLDRGKRTDVVTYYDTANLSPTGETKLPKGRFIVVTKKYDAAMTPGGRYLLSFNETPATSVDVVDVKHHKYLGDIQTRGCSLVMPSAERRFHMVCPNGSLLNVSFKVSGSGKLKADIKQDKPFFNVKKDPVFETPGYDPRDHMLQFVSYMGEVYPVDVSGASPKYEDKWSLFAQGESGWVPGGWMPVAYDGQAHHLYVLVHRGGKWTHKYSGQEVWVYDTQSHKRLHRIKLKEPAISIAISPDDAQLYALSDENSTLYIYNAKNGKLEHSVDQLGQSPMVLYTAKDALGGSS